jgi:hypothetical protein
MVEKSAIEIIVLLSAERHAPSSLPFQSFQSRRLARFFRLRTQHEPRVSISDYNDPMPVVEFPLLGRGGVARSGRVVRSGRFHNSVGLLHHKVQQLMAQVFAETPLGACMVSSEGACAAYYRYGRYQEVA